jgi:hypothetical protein
LRYIFDAGIISELEEYLVGNGYSHFSKQSFGIFAVQIIGNLVVHKEYAENLASHYGLCQWFCKSLTETFDNELRNEICITLRNLLHHNSSYLTGVLAQIGCMRILCSSLTRSKPKSKIQLICLEAINNMTTTHPPKSGSPFQGQTILLESSNPCYDYKKSLKESVKFHELLKVYEENSGIVLDEMDEQDHDELQSESDEENPEQELHNSLPFTVSNPHNPLHPHYQNQQFNTSNSSVSSKIAGIAISILRNIFPEELTAAIHQSQENAAVCQQLGGMDFGGSKVNDLADIFGKMAS